jgi:hypothetical protein
MRDSNQSWWAAAELSDRELRRARPGSGTARDMINAGSFDEVKIFRPVEDLIHQRDSFDYDSENSQGRQKR